MLHQIMLLTLVISQNAGNLLSKKFHREAWWVNSVVYQIYPLSFQDSDGDGIGDLKGIAQRIDYLKHIGVSAVWLTPIFQSPMKDNGYDVSDYYEINPIFGTMDDFVKLEKLLEDNGIRLILDLVPNHTSNQHRWFHKSVLREDDFTDYYIWVKPKAFVDGKPVPPNNWIDWMNSGSAWEWNEVRQEFYLHNFLRSQPDLNFRNPKVKEEFEKIIKFWFDKGVDGFRVDAVPYIYKDALLRDEPLIDPTKPRAWNNVDHIYTNNQPEVFDLIKELGDYVGKYIERDSQYRVIFIEAHVEMDFKVKYYGGFKIYKSPPFIIPFNFDLEYLVSTKSNATSIKTIIDTWMDVKSKNDVSTWIVGHHDVPRVATKLGEEFVDAMNMISFMLPGISIVYYGEEIGMHDTYVPYELTRDFFGIVLGPDRYQEASRDFYRTPMQWDSSTSAGFSKSKRMWLPVNANYWRLNVEQQKKMFKSHLTVFKELVSVKKSETMARGDLEVLTPNVYTLIIKRQLKGHPTYILVVNMNFFENKQKLSDYGVSRSKKVTVVLSSLHAVQKKGDVLRGPDFMFSLRPRAAILFKVSGLTEIIHHTAEWMGDVLHIAAKQNKQPQLSPK